MKAHPWDARKNLRVFIKQVRGMAKESAGLPSADNDDRRILKKDAKLLISSVESLIKIIESHTAYILWISDICEATRPKDQRDWEAKDPKEKAKLSELGAKLSAVGPFDPGGLVYLSSALIAAFFIGARAFDSPIFRQLEKDTKAALARAGRKAKSQQHERDILRLAEPILAENPTWNAPRIAARIANTGLIKLRDNSIEKIVRNKLKQLRTDK
jgi:hypothetical protein